MSEPDALRVALEAQAYTQNIVDTIRQPMLVLGADLRVRSAGRSFYQTFQATPEETEGRLIYELGNGQWDIPELRALLEDILPGHSEFDDYEIRHDFPTTGPRIMQLNARRVYRPGNNTTLILLAIEDVTERVTAEEAARAEHQRLTEALAREKRITGTLQRPLLLETPEDAFRGLSVATLFQPALKEAEVGGDFHDAFPLSDGRVAFAVGDASGKGLAAAVRAVEARDVLRAFMRLYPFYPALTLTRLNDYFCDALELDTPLDETFMAMAVVIVDVTQSQLTVAWAGIDAPAVRRADGRLEVPKGGGPALGVMRHHIYHEQTIDFHQGDVLVMMTDGLTEARREGQFLFHEGVLALLPEALGQPTLREAGLAVLDGVRAYCRNDMRDDACLVLVRSKQG